MPSAPLNVSYLMLAVAIMMIATALALAIAKRLNLGSIVALLVVGMALGPHSPMPLVTRGVDALQAVGEVGVALLMFAIGLDTQPNRLWSMRRLVFGLGSAQYALTSAALLALLVAIVGIDRVDWRSAVVASLGLAMSSTAVFLPILQERQDTGTEHGRAAVAIDIFQSFMVVPVLALIPLLGAGSTHDQHAFDIGIVLEVIGAIGGVFLLGRYVVPWGLKLTARDLGPGGFALMALAGVFLAGWWMETVGLSMALGAFMIGILLSSTRYADQIKAVVAPTRQLLLALFFIAIGMAVDLEQLAQSKRELLLYLPALLLVKVLVLFLLARAFRFGLRSAVLTAFLLMPCDEIAYVIFASASATGLMNAHDHTVGLAVISVSFLVSPMLINLAYKLTDRWIREPASAERQGTTPTSENRVIVAGYGYVGRTICIVLEQAQIPYRAFELDPTRLMLGEQSKHEVHYGDISDLRLMAAISIAGARLVIVTMGTYESTKRVIANLHQFYPRVAVMTAVEYLAQRDELRKLGASDVVALVPEGAVGFGSSVLDRLGVAVERAASIADGVRSNDYAALRVVDVAPHETATQSLK
jgi:glutathione-regulated potassium-efflux system ancillary protein KefC